MNRVETHDPDVMEWRGGGGCLALFGTPFLLVGLFIISIPFTSIPVKGNMPRWMIIPFGGVFASVGAALVFGRRGVIVDRRRKQVRTWWGLMVPFGGSERLLDEFRAIGLSREVRRSNNSSHTVFPVRLTGTGKPVTMGEPRRYEASRKLGEEMAKFIGLPLDDATSGTVVRRDAGTLDESVRDRMRRTGEKVRIPAPPAVMKTRVSFEGDTAVMEIPAAGFQPVFLVMFGFALIIPAFVGGFMIFPVLGEESEDPFRWVFVGFLSLFALGPILFIGSAILRAAKGRSTVTVSPLEVKVETRGGGLPKTVTLPIDEIEEIQARAVPRQAAALAAMKAGVGGILMRTDRRTVAIGAHLPGEELRHLKAVMEAVIASGG